MKKYIIFIIIFTPCLPIYSADKENTDQRIKELTRSFARFMDIDDEPKPPTPISLKNQDLILFGRFIPARTARERRKFYKEERAIKEAQENIGKKQSRRIHPLQDAALKSEPARTKQATIFNRFPLGSIRSRFIAQGLSTSTPCAKRVSRGVKPIGQIRSRALVAAPPLKETHEPSAKRRK